MFAKIPDYANRASKKLDFHVRSALPKRPSTPLAFTARKAIKELRSEGVAVKTLDKMGFENTSNMLDAVKALCPYLPSLSTAELSSDQMQPSSHRTTLKKGMLLEDPTVFLWGLQDNVLNLVEGYFQQPIAYLGCSLGCDVPKPIQSGLRLWHRDGEDYKVVKILIYLNDVDMDGGPFEYIPRKLSPSYRPFQQQRNIIRDADMERVVPRQLWKQCTGPEGTMIIADTVSVFHHASIPKRDRTVLTFAYASAKPKNLKMSLAYCAHFKSSIWAQNPGLLSPRQRQVAINWR